MNIAISSDHAGVEFKDEILKTFKDEYNITDLGTKDKNSVDYPDYVHPLADGISNKKYDMGILICGSGNGVSMTANRHKDVRAAVCWNLEITELARQHNDANIISIPARFVDLEEAFDMIECFFETEFEGGRHQNRVEKINIQ